MEYCSRKWFDGEDCPNHAPDWSDRKICAVNGYSLPVWLRTNYQQSLAAKPWLGTIFARPTDNSTTSRYGTLYHPSRRSQMRSESSKTRATSEGKSAKSSHSSRSNSLFGRL